MSRTQNCPVGVRKQEERERGEGIVLTLDPHAQTTK